MNLKEITDAEKPWFDYVAYFLRITAWFLAVAYASHQLLRERPPGMGFPFIEWASVFFAAGFGVFLTVRFIRMSVKMSNAIEEKIVERFKETGKSMFFSVVLLWLMRVWLFFAMPAFSAAVGGEIIEAYLEKHVNRPVTAPATPQAKTSPAP